MELDPRICEGKKPLTAFDTEEARAFIGQTGYLADRPSAFSDLLYVTKATLGDVGEADDSADEKVFKVSGCNLSYMYFLPEAWVKSTDEEEEFAWDSLELAGKLHFILHSRCYIGRGSVSNDDLKTIAEIMAKHSHEEEEFLRDVFERVLTFDEGRW